MKVIYIIGPYRAKTEWEVKENIRFAENFALFVWQYGAAAICPHKNTAFMGGAPGTNDDTWLKGGLEILSRCDAVWVGSGWKSSVGSVGEVAYARERSIPVLFTAQEVVNFLEAE